MEKNYNSAKLYIRNKASAIDRYTCNNNQIATRNCFSPPAAKRSRFLGRQNLSFSTSSRGCLPGQRAGFKNQTVDREIITQDIAHQLLTHQWKNFQYTHFLQPWVDCLGGTMVHLKGSSDLYSKKRGCVCSSYRVWLSGGVPKQNNIYINIYIHITSVWQKKISAFVFLLPLTICSKIFWPIFVIFIS